jgi:pimeloyl-ACP methyl ester carboxylesterase
VLRLLVRASIKATALSTVLAVLGAPLLFVYANTHSFHVPPARTPKDIGMAFRDVAFRTSDGLILRGWWVPAAGSARTLLLCHGVWGRRTDLFKYFPFLHAAGFNILTFDWRGHGVSDGDTITYGLDEGRDLQAAIAWLRARRPAESRWIGALGMSMGAGVLLACAGSCPELRAFVLDSPWASIRSMLPFRLRTQGVPAPLDPIATALVSVWCRILVGVWIDDIAPIDHVSELNGRPAFVIHGMADGVIPVEQSRMLCGVLPKPHECWLVEGVAHTEAVQTYPEEFHRRVLAFLARAP